MAYIFLQIPKILEAMGLILVIVLAETLDGVEADPAELDDVGEKLSLLDLQPLGLSLRVPGPLVELVVFAEEVHHADLGVVLSILQVNLQGFLLLLEDELVDSWEVLQSPYRHLQEV